jgi:hypothetical protein
MHFEKSAVTSTSHAVLNSEILDVWHGLFVFSGSSLTAGMSTQGD